MELLVQLALRVSLTDSIHCRIQRRSRAGVLPRGGPGGPENHQPMWRVMVYRGAGRPPYPPSTRMHKHFGHPVVKRFRRLSISAVIRLTVTS